MKYVNAAGEAGSFRFFQFLSMVQALLAAGLAFSQLLVQRMPLCGPIGQPHALTSQLFFNFFKIALASSVGSSLGYRSLKHINYPTMILGKSCKLVPVMLMNFLIYRKRFEAHKYFTVALITAGVSGFMLFEDAEEKQSLQGNSMHGLALLLANLLLDGTVNSWQDQLFLKYRLRSQQLMLFMNVFSGGLLAGSLLLQCALNPRDSQLLSAVQFARSFPSVIPDILAFSACGALGQLFIFYTLEHFGSLMLVTVTVTRKLFTILLNLFWFAHAVNWRQWACVGGVFAALVLEAVIGKKGAKKVAEGEEPEFQAIQDEKFLLIGPEKKTKKVSKRKVKSRK
jgi:UDP-galactose transporter B1